jgi:hypothetical protein
MATGQLWNTLFRGDELNIRKGLYGSLLVRDYSYSETSLTGFTPFNPDDGNLVDNLFDPDLSGGPWYDVGYLDETGPDFRPNMRTEMTKVFQSRRPARADYTEDSEEIRATLMESTPLVQYLIQNKPINSALPTVGTPDFAVGRPLELDILYRQLMAIIVDGTKGVNYYKVRLYPRVVLTKVDDIRSNAKKVLAPQLTFESFPDPYTVSPDGEEGSPVIIWEDGPAWRAQASGTAWPVPQTAPVATAETGGVATIELSIPTTDNSPFTYTVYQIGPDTTTEVDQSAAPIVSSGSVTLTVDGLRTGSDYRFFVVATGTDGSGSVPSKTSNTITATA